MDLTPEYIRQLVDYDPETGLLTWRERQIRKGLEKVDKNWNVRFAGKQVAPNIAAGTGYRGISFHCVRYNQHRIIWAHFYGIHPTAEVDHINRDKTDNRISNLRLASRSQNAMNSSVGAKNTSGVKGVCFHKASQKWHARICVDYNEIHLGLFATFEEACAARIRAEKEKFGPFSSL